MDGVGVLLGVLDGVLNDALLGISEELDLTVVGVPRTDDERGEDGGNDERHDEEGVFSTLGVEGNATRTADVAARKSKSLWYSSTSP